MILKCECCGSRKGLVRETETANVYCLKCGSNECDTCSCARPRPMQQIRPMRENTYKIARTYNNKRKW